MKRVLKLSFTQGLWIAVGSLLAVGVLFIFIHVTGVQNAETPREVPRIEWMPQARSGQLQTNDLRYVIADVFDPSLMSLPSAHGFSYGAWGRKADAALRNLGWNEMPAYLDVRAPDKPRSLLEPVPLADAVLSTAEKGPARSRELHNNVTESSMTVSRICLSRPGHA